MALRRHAAALAIAAENAQPLSYCNQQGPAFRPVIGLRCDERASLILDRLARQRPLTCGAQAGVPGMPSIRSSVLDTDEQSRKPIVVQAFWSNWTFCPQRAEPTSWLPGQGMNQLEGAAGEIFDFLRLLDLNLDL